MCSFEVPEEYVWLALFLPFTHFQGFRDDTMEVVTLKTVLAEAFILLL